MRDGVYQPGWLIRGMAGLIGACLLGVAIISIDLIIRERDSAWLFLWSCVILFPHALLALVTAVMRRRVRKERKRMGSLLELALGLFLAAGVLFIITLHLRWDSSLTVVEYFYPRSAASLLILGLAALQAVSMMRLSVKGEGMKWARVGVIGLFSFVGLFYIGMIWLEELLGQILPSSAVRVIGVSMSLLMVGSVLGTALFSAMVRKQERRAKGQRESVDAKVKIEMTCPGCGDELEMPVGLARCPSCGYGMMIEVEEPRCECGYLLYKLEGEVCPECGRKVGGLDSGFSLPEADL